MPLRIIIVALMFIGQNAHAAGQDPQDYYSAYQIVQQQEHTQRTTLMDAVGQSRLLSDGSPLSRFYQVLLQSQVGHPTSFEPYAVLNESDQNWLKQNAPVLYYRHEILNAYNLAVGAHWKEAMARLDRIETFARTADYSLYRDVRTTRGIFLHRLHYLDDALNEFSSLIDVVPLLESKPFYGEGYFEQVELRIGHILSQLGQTETAETLCQRSLTAFEQIHHNVSARMQLLALDCLRHNALHNPSRFTELNERYKALALDSQDLHSFVYALELQMRQLDTQQHYSDLLALYESTASLWISIADSYDGVSIQLVRLNALIATDQLSLADSEIQRLQSLLANFPQWPELSNRLQLSRALLLRHEGKLQAAFSALMSVKDAVAGLPLGAIAPPLVRSEYYTTTLTERRMALLQDSQRRTRQQLFREKSINQWLLAACLIGALLLTIIIYLFYRQALQKRLLSHLARFDSLTGSLSRRAACELIETELSRASRYEYPVSLALLDLDHFKKINDEYGHDAGDQVLITFCEMIQTHIRRTDIFGRFGGEEFILCMPSSRPEQARQLLTKLLVLTQSMYIEQYPLIEQCSFSAGLLHIREQDSYSTLVSLIKRCDELLYTAKKCGRGCFKEAPVNDTYGKDTSIVRLSSRR